MIWREILLQLLSLSGNEGDEHKWVIPSAISAEQHKEIIVRQILHHLGLFPSDAALESKILGFFAQRTAVTVQICRSGDMAWTVGDHGSRAYKKGIVVTQAQFPFTDVFVSPSPLSGACGGGVPLVHLSRDSS
jgi:hypothetical protein